MEGRTQNCDPLSREGGGCVIDDTVGPELPRELDVLRTADGSDVGAMRLGYLDGEASDAAGRTGDRNPLTCAKLSVIAQRLQCHRARDPHPGRFV